MQFYYWFFFAKFGFATHVELDFDAYKPVSVVICGKNEGNNFRKNIPKIAVQNHPQFEIVLVDDHSTDETSSVFANLQEEFTHITCVVKKDVPNRAGKKAALYAGVTAAKYEYIVVTDADCVPESEFWLQHMSASFGNETKLVLGISPNTKQTGFLRGLFRFETILTAMFYAGFALRGLPYMGVGRNMGFLRSVFLEQFTTILESNSASGDDDLYVNMVAKPQSTTVCLHPDSYTWSHAPKRFLNWFRQKQRHLSVGFRYKPLHLFLLFLYPIAQWLFLLSLIWLLTTALRPFALLILVFVVLIQQILNVIILRKLKQEDLALATPIYQILWLLLQPIIGLLSLLRSNKKWN